MIAGLVRVVAVGFVFELLGLHLRRKKAPSWAGREGRAKGGSGERTGERGAKGESGERRAGAEERTGERGAKGESGRAGSEGRQGFYDRGRLNLDFWD